MPILIFVVLKVEGLANAVSYDLVVPELNDQIFLAGASYGPTGGGFNIASPNGSNVALGECAIGFGGLSILVAQYTFVMPFETTSARTIGVAPNPDACTISFPLFLEAPIGTEATSFGQIKALY